MKQNVYSRRFKKDYKKVYSQNKSVDELLEKFIDSLPLDKAALRKYHDHALSGDYSGYRDCHLQPDLILIYKIDSNVILFERIGSHSELFG